MHVLILSLNYYPDQLGNAPILVGIAEGLVQKGHQVTVVCAFPHHETGEVRSEYRGKLMQHEMRHGVNIYRSFIMADQGGIRGKLQNYLSFSVSSLWTSLRSIKQVDLIFTPSPPLTLGWIDQALRIRFKAPYIYNLQDLFPEAAIRLGMITNPLAIRAFQWSEKQILRAADHLAVICEGFKTHAINLGVQANQVTVIPNFTDTDLITPTDSTKYREQWNIDPESIVILFSGRMGYSQGLQGVADAWELLSEQRDTLKLHLVLVGDGQAREALYTRLHKYTHVTFAHTQDRSHLNDLLACANIGLAPLKAGMSSTSVPSKILGLMAAGIPVIAQAEYESDTALFVMEAKAGVICPPEDAHALAQAIIRLTQDHQYAKDLGISGRKYIEDHLSQKAVIDRYESLFLDVIAHA
jgi:colanic acid biosynthesis glycosyl transferase WcaI